jgi:proliferating cell nuclear antigen
MYLQTIQASALRTIFEVLKDIINDVNVYFTPQGIKVITLDTAHVTLVHMFLPAENFEEYSCDSEIIAGVNLSNMYKLLKSVTNNDSLRMKIQDNDILEIEIENTVKHSVTQFRLKLLDINEDDLIVPDIDMDLVTTLPSVDFQRIARDMANLATDISIVRRGHLLELSCEGDFADQKTVIECGAPKEADPVGGVYPLKYINMYTKATNLCSNVQLFQNSQNPKLPLIVRYAIANLGDVRFYLAQKMEI